MKSINELFEENIKETQEKQKVQYNEKFSLTLFQGIRKFFLNLNKALLTWVNQKIFPVKITNWVKSIRISNFPKIQKIDGSVSVKDLSILIRELDRLKQAVEKKDVEFPEVQKIEGRVDTGITIPEIKIPDYPKNIEISNLKPLIEEVKKATGAVKKIKITFPKIDIPKPVKSISVDNLKELKQYFDNLDKRLQSLEEKEVEFPEDKSGEIIYALKQVRETIANIRFPIPSFQSSWQHSFSMQAEDLDKTYSWTTDGGKDVIEYIEVVALDGNTYRRTYTYDGTGKVASESKWVKQ